MILLAISLPMATLDSLIFTIRLPSVWDTTVTLPPDVYKRQGFTGQTELTEDTVHDEGDTCHVTTGLQECQEDKQYQHLRYETKHCTDTGYNLSLIHISPFSFITLSVGSKIKSRKPIL